MFVHSTRIKKQIEHLASKGIAKDPVYSLAEITQEEVLDPEKMFSFEQFHKVLEYAIAQTGDEYYGLHMGQEPHLAGTIGMMCASCKNLKEAFEAGCKIFKFQGNVADISFTEDKHLSKIEYTVTNAWKFRHPETARHEVDTMFAFLTNVLRINSNGALKPYQIKLTREAPESDAEYEQVLEIIPQYGQDANEMFFRKQDLLIPMKAFNPETFLLLKAHIEARIKRFQNEESVAEKVKSVLLSSMQYHFPDIETVASKLKTSARTLQRQLSGENTSFKSILQETKFEMAKQFLKQNVLTISEIGYTLGYSDPGNFSRSFKKYTGLSPQEYRSSVG